MDKQKLIEELERIHKEQLKMLEEVEDEKLTHEDIDRLMQFHHVEVWRAYSASQN